MMGSHQLLIIRLGQIGHIELTCADRDRQLTTAH